MQDVIIRSSKPSLPLGMCVNNDAPAFHVTYILVAILVVVLDLSISYLWAQYDGKIYIRLPSASSLE